MNEESKCDVWSARVLPGLSYAVAIGLVLTSPALMGGSLVLALVSGEASLVGMGLVAGALLGAAGAVALLWCLATSRKGRVGA